MDASCHPHREDGMRPRRRSWLSWPQSHSVSEVRHAGNWNELERNRNLESLQVLENMVARDENEPSLCGSTSHRVWLWGRRTEFEPEGQQKRVRNIAAPSNHRISKLRVFINLSRVSAVSKKISPD